MTPRREDSPQPTMRVLPTGNTWNRVPKARVEAGPDEGTFRPDGSWDDRPQIRTPCYAWVRQLIVHRQDGASPREIALIVGRGPFPRILGSSHELWLNLPHGECWPFAIAHCATSAAITIARHRADVRQPDPPGDCDCRWCTDLKHVAGK